MKRSGAQQESRIKILDTVRAAATSAVFLFHAGYLLTYTHTGILDWHRFVLAGGTVGVSVFFVLSGFVLFYQLYKNKEGLNTDRLKIYIKKRALRILPLYYFSLLCTILFLRRDIIFAADGLRSILYNIIFIRGIHGGGGITINPVYWTLIIELHFYIFLPIFYYFFYRHKKISFFFLLMLLGIMYRILIAATMTHLNMQLLRLTPANFDFFAFGMLGAYLYIERYSWVAYLGHAYIQVFLLALFMTFIYRYDLEFRPTVSYVFAPMLLASITMLGMLSYLMNQKTLLAKIYTCRPILYIAKISFGIYIWHAIVIELVEKQLLTPAAKFALDLVLTLLVSTITYYVIEAPFLKLKPKRALATPPLATQAVSKH